MLSRIYELSFELKMTGIILSLWVMFLVLSMFCNQWLWWSLVGALWTCYCVTTFRLRRLGLDWVAAYIVGAAHILIMPFVRSFEFVKAIRGTKQAR